ncbi:MAG: bifunctional proline dehydrogenase/L-glutamate gamma-semialdehyde dehydrogenase PutA [Proteobacteria bacterium]|nr:bifunctional proline dehydrogenase/L-glutamate gamma-semialdehyde dehydrogenase PutA [Pseudomonadota bacterium]
MIFERPPPPWDGLRRAIAQAYRADESDCVEALLAQAALGPAADRRIAERARKLVVAVREGRQGAGGIDAFLQEYELSSQEGVVLMCLAEALLRIPDGETADRLIRDKLGDADWEKHLGHSDSLFVNASTWGLMLTGRVVRLDPGLKGGAGSVVGKLFAKSGEPVIRRAMVQAMRILGRQFVMGRTIEEALARARPAEAKGYRHSFDMLGEAAHCAADADAYFEAYRAAIDAIGASAGDGELFAQPSISVKLSALHARYEYAQGQPMVERLAERLLDLAQRAKAQGIGLAVDAEEADRLDPSLDIFAVVYRHAALVGWEGFGMVVQAYLKRAPMVIDWLAALARDGGRRIPVRLVKGAYWDSEIKRAQEQGLDGYPVFTRKLATDVSYIACARRLFDGADAFYPQFATHNAQTLAVVLELAGSHRDFEFQRLHGMGEALYGEVVGPDKLGLSCRVYAPVGSHESLLPYLVRRLLENGANTSFVNRITDEALPVEDIATDPVARLSDLAVKPHPRISPPLALYGAERVNSRGIDLSDRASLEPLAQAMSEALDKPLTAGDTAAGKARPIHDPADRRRLVGHVVEADEEAVDEALDAACAAAPDWAATAAEMRAACLDRAADLLEENTAEAMAIAIREAGKTIPDALAEIREAVDFCRYYALRARADFAEAAILAGPTGETNRLSLHGRGTFVCISPWNFPLAIFTGQVTAALVAGNAVIAKPAEQTPLMAAFVVRLLHRAGVPEDALRLLPGDGALVGARLVGDPRIAGVAFTGSTETAWAINRNLAAKSGPIVPLIAETGGQNAMIVDSSALPEQVVMDVLGSAFGAAGQRCSALRVLFLQAEIAPRTIAMISGAMDGLRIGDPALLATDIGPVIDAAAKAMLEAHGKRMARLGTTIVRLELPPEAGSGSFVAPMAFEIDRLDQLTREVFGPILHVIRYRADRLDAVIDAINGTGYGLTLGIHSRIDEVVNYISTRVRAGNVYVNRNMTGAVVGVQPFGGEGLSGTGPKAGGPRYLNRFANERSFSIDTTAAGGNASLLSLEEAG